MDDYISRQALIDATDDKYSLGDIGRMERDIIVDALKYATPADVRPVVLCGECRWFTDTGYPIPDPDMPELRMGHCLFLVRDVQACWFCGDGAEVVRGRWEWNEDDGHCYCTVCGSVSPEIDQNGDECDCPNFCPNCGADMKEEEQDGSD